MNAPQLRVWLVDDDASIRWVLERALRGGETKAILLAVLFALVVVATLNIPLGWLVIGAVGATAYYGFGVGRSGARSGAAGGRHTEPTPQDAPRW